MREAGDFTKTRNKMIIKYILFLTSITRHEMRTKFFENY